MSIHVSLCPRAANVWRLSEPRLKFTAVLLTIPIPSLKQMDGG